MTDTTTTGAADGGPDTDESLSYEQARDALTDVVRRLEAGGLTLQESLDLWERGERLARTCESWLEGARAKLAAAMEEGEEGAGAAGGAEGGGGPGSDEATPF